jgi:hypothetical protein
MKATLTIIALVMTCIIAFVIDKVNYGFHTGFAVKWMKSWACFRGRLAVMMVITPIICKALAKHVIDLNKQENNLHRNL